MADITNIQADDRVKDSRAVINTNFDNLNTDKVETLSDLGITITAAEVNRGISAGAIVMWAGTAQPVGWLFCRGQAVSRTTYVDLFTAIGTTYGVGDGSTSFNLPNLQGRVPVGFDTTQTEFDAVGETGGEKTHTLTESEMPAHSHGGPSGANFLVNDPDTVDFLDSGGVNGAYVATTGSTGGSNAHNNLQPYITLNFIIRT